ncbi:MAG: TonB-dependent receptor [Acidobacteriota bacterium]
MKEWPSGGVTIPNIRQVRAKKGRCGMARVSSFWVFVALAAASLSAQQITNNQLSGLVTDETGGVLPGVTIELRSEGAAPMETVTDGSGEYLFNGVAPGKYQVAFTLINFASILRRDVKMSAGPTRVDAVMHLSLSAEVAVIGKRTFANLADMEDPEENLVGVAESASQGAITARQFDGRPLMRVGEVLETVPGMIASSHAGGGKANQYFLRGFNLDHGTDFAQTIGGLPVNLPSHAHGQGYSDINFMIPELVAGVQYSKGPYYADQGDFATAGSANTNYVTSIDRPLARFEIGGQGYGRALFAASQKLVSGNILAALDVSHTDGPWVQPDAFQKINGIVRYSQGDAVNGFTLTAMGYHGQWNSTDTVPQRAITSGTIGRFGTLDPSDGGDTYRYSASGEWQRGSNSTLTKITAYGIGYNLNLFSNFTFYLDDPIDGDQHEQADHRFVTGVKVTHKRQTRWHGHTAQNTFGVQVRNDAITNVALYHTNARVRLSTASRASVLESTGGAYAQNAVEWAPWLRSIVGLRADVTRFRVTDHVNALNGGTTTDGIVSPKGSVAFGPWARTEFYINAGEGFHSNDARGALATRDFNGNAITPVTPLVKARGAEVGIRTVIVPHLQTTLAVWTLRLASELTWDGDTFGSVPSPASKRSGVELANYYSPNRWLIFDGDVSWSEARFTEFNPAGPYVPEAVGTVVSAGATVDNLHRSFGSLRWRYFGPRALIEDDSQRSNATSLFELAAGYQLAKKLRVTAELFNLFNSSVSDIDYYFVSRLPGEPLTGVADVMTHPTLARSARINLAVGF